MDSFERPFRCFDCNIHNLSGMCLLSCYLESEHLKPVGNIFYGHLQKLFMTRPLCSNWKTPDPVSQKAILLGPKKVLKGIVPQFVSIDQIYILDSNGVWYCSFWSEGSIKTT